MQFLPQTAEIFWEYEDGCPPPPNGGEAKAEGVDASIVTDE